MVQVSVVIPSYNESTNLSKLIPLIFDVFYRNNLVGEVIVVDDSSPDGSADVVRDLQRRFLNLRLISRPRKLGLSSAILDGFREASGDIVGVIDADFSHPPDKIPELVAPILRGEADITVGSRYVRGGRIVNWPLLRRVTSFGAVLLGRPLTGVKDLVSGFFFLRRDVLDGVELNPLGFKILLEILVRCRYGSVKEIPITFTDRKGGKSKLNTKEYLDYIRHCIRLYASKLR